MTAEPADDTDVLLFQSADRSRALISCIEQDGPVHGVGGFARFFHFKITYWVNHWCDVNILIVHANVFLCVNS